MGCPETPSLRDRHLRTLLVLFNSLPCIMGVRSLKTAFSRLLCLREGKGKGREEKRKKKEENKKVGEGTEGKESSISVLQADLTYG